MAVRELSRRNFRRILIIKPSSFGDVIHALPVLNGLRHRFPRARISWLVAHSCAGLLEAQPALDETILFDRKRYGRIARNVRVTVEFADFLQTLRARRFDLVLDLQGLFRSGFLAFASGADVRVGFSSAREFAWTFYTHRVAVRDPNLHAVDRNYLFARALGFADVPLRFTLPIQPVAKAAMGRMLEQAGLPPGDAYVLIAPGTRWQTKTWPAERFAELARRLHAEYGLTVVLAGMRSEAAIAAKVAELAGAPIVNLSGRTSLAELIALVDGAALVVMHDSGPMHLAAALNKPMVAIYGPTSPQLTGPYARPGTVIRLAPPCSPCRFKTLTECPHDHRCLGELSPELVMQHVRQVLGAAAPMNAHLGAVEVLP